MSLGLNIDGEYGKHHRAGFSFGIGDYQQNDVNNDDKKKSKWELQHAQGATIFTPNFSTTASAYQS